MPYHLPRKTDAAHEARSDENGRRIRDRWLAPSVEEALELRRPRAGKLAAPERDAQTMSRHQAATLKKNLQKAVAHRRKTLEEAKAHNTHLRERLEGLVIRGRVATLLIEWLRSDSPISAADREHFTKILGDVLSAPTREGQPRDETAVEAANFAIQIYFEWKAMNAEDGVAARRLSDKMLDKSIGYAIEILKLLDPERYDKPPAPAAVLSLIKHSSARRIWR